MDFPLLDKKPEFNINILGLNKADSRLVMDFYGSAANICMREGHDASASNVITSLAATVGFGATYQAALESDQETSPISLSKIDTVLFGGSINKPSEDSVFGTMQDLAGEIWLSKPIPLKGSLAHQTLHNDNKKCLSIAIPDKYQPTFLPLTAAKNMYSTALYSSHQAKWDLWDFATHTLMFAVSIERTNIPEEAALRLASDVIIGVSRRAAPAAQKAYILQ